MKTKQKTRSEAFVSSDKFYCDDITEAVGNIPLIRLRRLTSERNIKATVLVKPEYFNPLTTTG